MNAIRRKTLKAIIKQLEELDSLKQSIQEQLQEVIDEEQEAFDNMPESLQYSDRGEQMEEYIGIMEEAVSNLESLDVDDIMSQLEDI